MQTITEFGHCNQGVMTEQQFKYFEDSFARASQSLDDRPVTLKLCNRSALTFLSKFIGLVKGASENAETLRKNQVVSCGDPCFSETALLATSTESRKVAGSELAVFGPHGFVSKTLGCATI